LTPVADGLAAFKDVLCWNIDAEEDIFGAGTTCCMVCGDEFAVVVSHDGVPSPLPWVAPTARV
jgi:hypothetical protein